MTVYKRSMNQIEILSIMSGKPNLRLRKIYFSFFIAVNTFQHFLNVSMIISFSKLSKHIVVQIKYMYTDIKFTEIVSLMPLIISR